MEPLVEFNGQVKPELCIICQKRTTEGTSKAKELGWNALQKATRERKNLLDTEFATSVERIDSFASALSEDTKVLYHRSCYEKYTNKSKISRLKLKAKAAAQCALSDTPRTLRSSVGQPFNKLLCIICQEDKDQHLLRRSSSYNVNEKLESLARRDYNLKRRMTCAFDSMAGDVMYHTYCPANKERDLKKVEMGSEDSNVSYQQLCFELHGAAGKGQVLVLSSVLDRYVILSRDVNESVPQKYMSRVSTFREKLEKDVNSVFQFYRPMEREINERKTLLIPHKLQHRASVDQMYGHENLTIPSYEPEAGSDFLELVHVALQLRKDLKATQGYEGLNVSKKEAESVIPERVHLFLSVLFGGQQVLDNIEDASKDCDEAVPGALQRGKIVSIAQDLMYVANNGRKLTPKHIGLALTLHQETRSKELVTLFNKAGHCASYDQVLQMDTAMAKVTIQTMDPRTGAVVPVNLKHATQFRGVAPPLHVTADNIDFQMDSLDGKKDLHATQMVAFQRGSMSLDEQLRSTMRTEEKSLKIPQEINKIISTSVEFGKTIPKFEAPVDEKLYKFEEIPVAAQDAQLLDAAFFLHREHITQKVGWTEFNTKISSKDPELCNAGYMPIILDPAHNLTTLNTVLERCIYLADTLGYDFVILTVDQQLYCRLLELKWSNENYQKRVVLRMGGLHIALNFLKVIGQHMAGSGLLEVWTESGVVSEGSAKKVEEGKAYNKGMRLHKLTAQALWRIFEPSFLNFLEEDDPVVASLIEENRGNVEDLLFVLKEHNVLTLLDKFAESAQSNVNFDFWWSYFKMVSLLLLFTRSIREGLWDLYMYSITQMLALIARYDHHNYLKSMAAYIAEMNQLPDQVLSAFQNGDFVVKRGNGKFNQVDPDQAQEWLVGDGKSSGGIVGLVQHDSALQRWALTFNWRAEICLRTKIMFNVVPKLSPFAESQPSRRARDQLDENSILRVLTEFELFDPKHAASLRNAATKDVATKTITASLLSATRLGEEQVINFVKERLSENRSKNFYETVKLNRPLTFQSLYQNSALLKVSNERKKTKEDRSILQRVIMAYEAGRAVDLSSIVKHELFEVPLSLAQPDGSLRTGSKSDLIKLVVKNIDCPPNITYEKRKSHLIVDGQALIMSIGLPKGAKNFDEFSAAIYRRLVHMGSSYTRVDIVFDRYDVVHSIKSHTRAKRGVKARPIRKTIDSGSVPLPKSWENFIALSENKAELAHFLSRDLLARATDDLEIIVAGGFPDPLQVVSSNALTDVTHLKANHEEADTRLILHAMHSPHECIVLSVRDTDVLLLLIHHFQSFNCSECWMMTGTSKTRQYIPVHELHSSMQINLRKNLLAFHSVTGCDTTSFLASIGKKTAYAVFGEHADLLDGLGVHPLTEIGLQKAEQFVVRLYGISDVTTTDEARYSRFGKISKPEALPPSSDALKQHLLRAHYQAFVWRSSVLPIMALPSCEDFGWHVEGDTLKPTLMTLEAVPKSCETLVSCGCKKGCRTRLCKCRRTLDINGESLKCILSCKCGGSCD